MVYSVYSGRLESILTYDFLRGHAIIGGVAVPFLNPFTGLFR